MEHTAQQPSELAREAIKRLAARKLPPTPENFKRAYLDVQGKPDETPPWGDTLRTLLKQWDAFQTGLTQSKKRDMLDRVLINFGNDPSQLVGKLGGLAKSWSESGASGSVREDAPEGGESPAQRADKTESAKPLDAAAGEIDPNRLGRLVAEYLQGLRDECGYRWPDLAGRSDGLAAAIEGQDFALEEADVTALGKLWREILVRAEDDYDYVVGLKHLLALLFDNIGELVAEDVWLSGQLATMKAVLAGELSHHALHDAERSLQEVVQRQKSLKGSLVEAKEKLRHLISTFVSRVGEISDSTGGFHERIQYYSARIAQADDISQLSEVVDSLSTDMVQIHGEMKRTHEELLDARSNVEEAEQRIHHLEQELEEVASLVREDQLTGALNRRGMDEAFERESSRAARSRAPLTISLLDIDHFKKLNDSLGHQVGDQALIHLARVVHGLLRPTDTLARYGGEEFLILLPNTEAAEGQIIMQRVQRELTKQFFMHDNQKVLITFSAGVAQMQEGEARDVLLGRADAAMYRAKTSGRNRVELA